MLLSGSGGDGKRRVSGGRLEGCTQHPSCWGVKGGGHVQRRKLFGQMHGADALFLVVWTSGPHRPAGIWCFESLRGFMSQRRPEGQGGSLESRVSNNFPFPQLPCPHVWTISHILPTRHGSSGKDMCQVMEQGTWGQIRPKCSPSPRNSLATRVMSGS